MGIHYTMFCFDDHLGYGSLAHKAAEELNHDLLNHDVCLFHEVEYNKNASCIIGEIRNYSPSRLLFIFNRFDHVYYNQDNSGVKLAELE